MMLLLLWCSVSTVLLILFGGSVPFVAVTLVDRGHSVTVTVVVNMSTKGRLVTDTVSLYGFLNVHSAVPEINCK